MNEHKKRMTWKNVHHREQRREEDRARERERCRDASKRFEETIQVRKVQQPK